MIRLQRRSDLKTSVIVLVALILITSISFRARHSVLKILPPLRGSTSSPHHEDLFDLFSIPPVSNDHIRSVCSKSEWNETLIFTCNESFGGIGNVRNSILECIRFAMHAGASMVLPQILLREEDISKYKTHKHTDFAYMFDTEHFLASMRASCPQMTVYPTFQDALDKHGLTSASDLNRVRLSAEKLTGEGSGMAVIESTPWRGKFYDFLAEQRDAGALGSHPGPTVVDLERCYMSYPIFADGEAFANSFGLVLLIREDVRLIASQVLRLLAKRLGFAADDEKLKANVLPDAYFGAHLRVEADAQATWTTDFGWTHASYEKQAEDYLAQAVQSGRTHCKGIYIASGDAEGIKRFVKDAAKQNYTAVDKFDVLQSGVGYDQLQSLRWDQQALVDYLILLRGSDFAGVAHSSFSWSVALKRHTWTPKGSRFLDNPEKLHDDLSVLYGPVGGEQFTDALWP